MSGVTKKKIRLAVIPTDPIKAYVQKGTSSWLEDYYNPLKFADEVYALSPFEDREYFEFGMKIIPTQPHQLKNRIRNLNINLVRAYGGYTSCDMACNNKVSGVPVIVSVHDTNPVILHNSIKNADFVFCMSEAVKKLVMGKYKREDHVWILPNRVNFEIMKPSKIEDLEKIEKTYPFKYRILHVGRKTEQKNLDTLLFSLKYLSVDYCLIAVGKSYDDSYVKLAKKIGIYDRCFFIETIPNEQLSKLYSFVDCMCTPSRWEGFGLVFIEALACEAVVVTSDIAPMNELIDDGYNGILVKDYENPVVLANAIRKACTDNSLKVLIKTNARQSVSQFEKNKVDLIEVSYNNKVIEMNKDGASNGNTIDRINSSLRYFRNPFKLLKLFLIKR